MSTWGFSNFENDTVAGFINDLNINGYGLIEVVLKRVIEENEPTVSECEEALIAAELVAAAMGKPSDEITEIASEWVGENLPPGSAARAAVAAFSEPAADAIDRVVTDSELKELWQDHEAFSDWFNEQIELQNRLLDTD